MIKTSIQSKFFINVTLILSFTLISISGKAPAHAAPNKTSEARAWVKRGEIALNEGQLREALLAFESADRYSPSVNNRMMIAKVYEAMPKAKGCLRAISVWQVVIKELKAQSSALLSNAQKKITDLEKSCTRQISVRSEPSGAKVWIEDELIGFTPLVASIRAEHSTIKAIFQKETQTQTLSTDVSEVMLRFGHSTSQELKESSPQGADVFNTSLNHPQTPIRFEATLKCRALVGQEYQELSSCQSRALWEGDQFKVDFHSDQDVYLYVFLKNDSGQRQTLFPRGNTPNRLPAMQRRSLPFNDWFTLDDVGPVTEKIYVIYSSSPVPAFESQRNLNDKPHENKNHLKLKTLAMRSVRGVVLPDSKHQLKLSVSDTLDDQSHFIGRDEINRVEFELFHQGARPSRAD
jgi:hypothetical protein